MGLSILSINREIMQEETTLLDQAARFLAADGLKDIVAKIIFLQQKGLSEGQIETVKDMALKLLSNPTQTVSFAFRMMLPMIFAVFVVQFSSI